jgi:hypothetical protein
MKKILFLLLVVTLVPVISYTDEPDYFSALGVTRINPIKAPDFTVESLN